MDSWEFVREVQGEICSLASQLQGILNREGLPGNPLEIAQVLYAGDSYEIEVPLGSTAVLCLDEGGLVSVFRSQEVCYG